MTLIEAMRMRRSVRTFKDNSISEAVMNELKKFVAQLENPFGIEVDIKFLNVEEHKLSSPVIVGAKAYAAGKIKQLPMAEVAFGYSFEKLLIYGITKGLGTVWLAGTIDRKAFEAAMDLGEDEIMPAVSPLGYEADKMSMREKLMRKSIKADERLDFEKLFFAGDFEHPLSKNMAGALELPFEMVRLAPSAVNKQPWRVVVDDKEKKVHFFLLESKGYGKVQRLDLGIALYHFEAAAEEERIKGRFTLSEPNIELEKNMHYIATFEMQ